MARSLLAGLYEELLTEGLARAVEEGREAGWSIAIEEADEALRPELLARHVYGLVRSALASTGSGATGLERQVALVNDLVALLERAGEREVVHADDLIARGAELLREVRRPRVALGAAVRPSLSLRESGLLINGHRDYQIGGELAREIHSADRIDLLCAFIRFAGLRLVKRELEEFLARGGRLRVIASVYTGSTQKRALDELVAMGAEVKVSYETAQTRLHAKAWLFHRDTGFTTAYVGSSNLTHTALVEGLEWNVRVSAVDNPGIVERVAAAFAQYWEESEFRAYLPERDGERLERALELQRRGKDALGAGEALASLAIDVEPKPHQRDILEALEGERAHGHWRNLVVAATGTGKTWVAAFDYERLRRTAGGDRLLFVAHRDEILRQTQQVFQLVLRDAAFGERWVAAERPIRGRHVFASVQTLTRYADELDPEQFDVVIVDEFHHAAAPTYERLLRRLRPRVLLGLTATPERADGQTVLGWFDDRVAYELRLWQALEQGLLCPFHYFGINDATDLRGVAFKRGRYDTRELEGIYTGDHLRARRVIQSLQEHVHDPRRMRGLGFCVGVGHARFMAAQFQAAGLAAVALDGTSAEVVRRDAVRALRAGELRAIFTVDLFNEGVDLPEVDTVLLLRPTESATVFLQQLGRGLRWAPGKSHLTVLDFIGQAHRDYRFDTRYRAILGGTRKGIEQALRADFPLLPPGCAIKLDPIARETVLAHVSAALRGARRHLLEELRAVGPEADLTSFLEQTGFELADVYPRPQPRNTYTALRRELGFETRPATAAEPGLAKAFGRSLHVDDDERVHTWLDWLRRPAPPAIDAADTRARRLALMLFAVLGHRKRAVAELPEALAELWANPPLREELIELLALVGDASRSRPAPLDPCGRVPLASHASYSLYEIIAAAGLVGGNGALRETREGVLWAEAERTDLLFITFDKSSSDFSPSTRYADYPISPVLLHWESQNATTADSPTGRRYVEHARTGSKVLIFVRERKRDARREPLPYLCLGYADYVSHQSERPMQVVWRLHRPMPAWLYQAAKLAGG